MGNGKTLLLFSLHFGFLFVLFFAFWLELCPRLKACLACVLPLAYVQSLGNYFTKVIRGPLSGQGQTWYLSCPAECILSTNSSLGQHLCLKGNIENIEKKQLHKSPIPFGGKQHGVTEFNMLLRGSQTRFHFFFHK